MRKRIRCFLTIMIITVFALSMGICFATEYGHGVSVSGITSYYTTRNTSWTPAANPGLNISIDCKIKDSSSKAYITAVRPTDSYAIYEYAYGRVWTDKNGASYTSHATYEDTNGSNEKSLKYNSLYTFTVYLTDVP